mmetsp:Transcript_19768/g.54442  ORF Transcript_19768/g.54442 Transcript_19768/m.54442 type:complete len:326 (-) Transcript_19768:136-1113(-)
MPSARLSTLLRRFGLADGVAVADLHAAYLRRARELHPDSAQGQDGSAFIHLRQDYEEARRILEAPAKSHQAQWPPPWTEASQWPQPPPRRPAQAPSAAGPAESTSAGSPPILQLVVLLGTGSFLGIFGRPALWEGDRPAAPAQAPEAPRAPTRKPRESPTDLNAEPMRTAYYSGRVKRSEPSAIWKSRPHSKQRGSVYVSPVHAAAEDGKAEWLHWVGEANRIPLCQSLDRNQQTPLHYAARAGQRDACAVLLKFQASPLDVDSKGRTPLDLAKEAGHEDLAQMLRQGGQGPLAAVQFRKKPSLRSQNTGVVSCSSVSLGASPGW